MLRELIAKNDGLIMTKQVSSVGIPREYILQLVENGKLERVERGVYISIDGFDDEMYRIQAKYSSAIFSHDSALYLHDLTDRDPIQYSVTVASGYNTTALREKGLQVYSVKKKFHQIGLEKKETICGRQVTCYNKERTICDMVRSRSSQDSVILYVRSKDKDIPKLMKYSRQLRVEKILKTYLEVLL